MKFWLTFLFRIALGALFLISGFSKILDTHSFAHALETLEILPANLIPIVSFVLPFVEVFLGFMLLAGFLIRQVSYCMLGLLLLFSAVILVQILRGNTVACNCFGAIWQSQTDIPALLRNLLLAGMAIIVARQNSDLLSLDKFIKNIKRETLRQFFAHHWLEIIAVVTIFILLSLSIGLAQKIRAQNRGVAKVTHSHKLFVFQPFTVSQQDSSVRVY